MKMRPITARVPAGVILKEKRLGKAKPLRSRTKMTPERKRRQTVRSQGNNVDPGSPNMPLSGCCEFRYPYPMLKAIKTNAASLFGVITNLQTDCQGSSFPFNPSLAQFIEQGAFEALDEWRAENIARIKETAWFGFFPVKQAPPQAARWYIGFGEFSFPYFFFALLR
jgi:hypothetical protein